jgi:hypothetical protein
VFCGLKQRRLFLIQYTVSERADRSERRKTKSLVRSIVVPIHLVRISMALCTMETEQASRAGTTADKNDSPDHEWLLASYICKLLHEACFYMFS